MPDLNGVQTGSIKAPVFRGHGGGIVAGENKTTGQIDHDAIRNITGTLGKAGWSITGEADGAFLRTSLGNTNTVAGQTSQPYSLHVFDASLVVPTAPENRMNSVYGIWICRAGDTTTEISDPTKNAVLTGGNTFNGSQKVVGNLDITGKIEADIKPLLNAIGEAPIYACRAWVNFRGTDSVAINASGNVLSIIDNGVGDYTINFEKPMPHTNYCVLGTAAQGSTASGSTSANIVAEYKNTSTTLGVKTVNAVRIATVDNNQDSFFDSTSANVAIFC